ncbi:MAG: serine/threonine-protein kinase [Planctomycetaceae bacterium]
MVHRDLKPRQFVVSGTVAFTTSLKVLDFGLVKLTSSNSEQLSSDQMISGTPQYMAPEQVLGEPDLDARCDLYALGCIAYYMLTGRPPFEERSPMAVMIAHTNQTVIPPSELVSTIPNDFETLIMKCLEKNRDDRFQSAFELQKELKRCANFKDWDANQAALWWEELEEEISAT